MADSPIETMSELWAPLLRKMKLHLRPFFMKERVARSAGVVLDGLLGGGRRATGWMRTGPAGGRGPWRQQAILVRGLWDAKALRDVVGDYVAGNVADADAVLVIDETGFLKRGSGSCVVATQYSGSAGKITNCQIGVVAAKASCHAHAFIGRMLYLRQRWTDDPACLAAAHVSGDVAFATKPRLAVHMIRCAIAASGPFRRAAADSVHGVGEADEVLRRPGLDYVLGVSLAHRHHSVRATIRVHRYPEGHLRLSTAHAASHATAPLPRRSPTLPERPQDPADTYFPGWWVCGRRMRVNHSPTSTSTPTKPDI